MMVTGAGTDRVEKEPPAEAGPQARLPGTIACPTGPSTVLKVSAARRWRLLRRSGDPHPRATGIARRRLFRRRLSLARHKPGECRSALRATGADRRKRCVPP